MTLRLLLVIIALVGCTPAAGPAPNVPRHKVERWWRAEPEVGVAGIARDTAGEPLPGATIVASSPSMPHEQVVITDDNGAYRLPLAPAEYLLTLYYIDVTLEASAVTVRTGGTTHVDFAVDTSATNRGETIQIKAG
jgi:hypothetical protein